MATSRVNKIGAGIVVLAVLGFLVYRQNKKDTQLGAPTTTSADMPTVSGPEDVDKISITNGEKGEVVLEKKDDKWVLTKPLQTAANQQNVKSLVDNLKELKAKEIVTDNADDAVKISDDLTPTKGIHVIAWKGADKKVDDTFGKSGGRGEMMMVDGKPGIYAASGYSSFLYTRDLKGWRDTEVFKFDDANASQLTIENSHGVLSFTKGDKWAGTFKGQPIDRYDDAKVTDALRTFKNLNAEDFADGKSPGDTGLDQPEATLTITLKDNAGKYVVRVGKVSTGTSRFAQKDGSDMIYILPGFASDWAVADVARFEKAPDAGAAKDAGGAVDAGAVAHPLPPHAAFKH
jgi:hypothetical protein